jgi:hypothetical protein
LIEDEGEDNTDDDDNTDNGNNTDDDNNSKATPIGEIVSFSWYDDS